MSWYLTVLWTINDKCEVRVLRIGNPTLQIGRQSGLWQLWIALLGQDEVIKVVETLDAIVASEYVQAVLNDLTCMTEAASRRLKRSRLILLVSCGTLVLGLILLGC